MVYRISSQKSSPTINIGDAFMSLGIRFLIENDLKKKSSYIDRLDLATFKCYGSESSNVIMSAYFGLFGCRQKSFNNPCISYNYIGFHFCNLKGVPIIKYNKPFGCRDFGTADIFKSQGLNTYVSLCSSLLLDEKYLDIKDSEIKRDLVIYNEFPYNKKFLDKNALRIVNTYDDALSKNWLEWESIALNRLKFLKTRAKIVYTGRLHTYLSCIALNIPVVWCRDTYSYRTEIQKIVNKNTILDLKQLIRQNYIHEIFHEGEDVHQELNNLCYKIKNNNKNS